MKKVHGRTGLDDVQYEQALCKVRDFLHHEDRITNSKLRLLTHLNYDQAIKFFKRATAAGTLQRRGIASGTHYVSPGRSD